MHILMIKITLILNLKHFTIPKNFMLVLLKFYFWNSSEINYVELFSFTNSKFKNINISQLLKINLM